MDCRTWNYQGIEHALPPKEMIINALLKEIYGMQDQKMTISNNYALPENLKYFSRVSMDHHRDGTSNLGKLTGIGKQESAVMALLDVSATQILFGGSSIWSRFEMPFHASFNAFIPFHSLHWNINADPLYDEHSSPERGWMTKS